MMREHLTADYEREADLEKPVSGERRLVLSVVLLALEDALPHLKRKRTSRRRSGLDVKRRKEAALCWLLREQDPSATRVMSVEWCCGALDFPVARLRNRILASLGRPAPKSARPYKTLRYSELVT